MAPVIYRPPTFAGSTTFHCASLFGIMYVSLREICKDTVVPAPQVAMQVMAAEPLCKFTPKHRIMLF